jgi:uncharacterized protein (DUF2141 family)
VHHISSLRRHARSIFAALLFLFCTCEAWGTDSYIGGQLTIPSVTIGSATFSNMVVTVAGIVIGPNGTGPNGSVDMYNPANNQLTVQSVTVGAKTYYNVVITVGTLISIGGVSGADVYTGTDLIIPSVQVLGGAVVNNVVITVLSIQSAGGGMPKTLRDVYNPATKELTIAAVAVGSHVYTNAIITPNKIVSIGNVLASANGTITGAWVQGVTITVSGGASGTTSTDVNGNYSFTKLPSGQSFTFTPSLSGYTFASGSQTVPIPAGSSTAVTVPAMTASSANPSYSISGTVNYSGNATGPVYVLLFNTFNTCGGGCSSNGGTLVRLSAGSSAYTIRGLQNGSYTVSAFMDTLGTGQPNTSADPSGSTATINITSSNITTGANITLTNPTVTTPAAPSIVAGAPGPSSVFVLYNPTTDNNGFETATSYTLSWGTDTNASNGSTKIFAAQGTNSNVLYVPNLTNGTSIYFKLRATNSAGSSAFSAVTGPVIIGEPTGNNTVSGTVTFGGTATGPMIVVVHPHHGNGGIYYTVVGSQASPPTSGASYSITGVPTGNYQLAVIIDNNNTGVVSAGDFTYGFNGGAPTFAVSGATTESVTLTSADATAVVLTNYFIGGGGSGYGLNLGALSGTKQLINLTLMSGPNVAVPFDMGFSPNNGNMFVNLANGSTAPVSGQNYGFLVTFTDGSTQIIAGSVSAVLGPNNVAQNLLASSASGADTPTFSWSAPATPPAFLPFIYSLQNLGSNNSIDVLSSVTSVDLAIAPYMQTLTTGTYYWQVQVQDALGNNAQVQVSTPYQAP